MAVEGPSGAATSSSSGAAGAWAGLMHQVGVNVPLELRRAIRARAALRRLKAGKV